MSAADSKAAFPPGVGNLFWFFFFNFLSVEIVIDTPIILYAEHLEASATVLGFIAGLTSLMVVFQIPAANHVQRVGYKRFVILGWTGRLCFVAALALVPLAVDWWTRQSRLLGVLLLLIGFNLVRGIASCAWFPWIAGLVPEPIRGRYLTRENAFSSIGSLCTMVLSAFYLGAEPREAQFAVLFALSLGIGLLSLVFLHRVPDVPVTAEEAANRQPVPWRVIARHPAFRKLLWVNLAFSAGLGGLLAFVVDFLEGPANFTDQHILLITSAKFVGGLTTLWFLGTRLDRLGSRPVIFFSLSMWILILGGWALLAGGVLPLQTFLRPMAPALLLFMGFAGAMVSMALSRLAMATVPGLGQTHFFALYSVVGSLSLGLFPVVWGAMIDLLHGSRPFASGQPWNEFSLYFTAVAGVMLMALILARRLEEPRAARFEELLRDLVHNSPLRFWLRQ